MLKSYFMHLILGLSRYPSSRTSIELITLISSVEITVLLLWLSFFSLRDVGYSSIEISMKDTIRSVSLFFGAFTTMMNSWFCCGPILTEIRFWSSLERGFSMNQQLNSFSEFLIWVPSSYEKGSSSLLYWPKIVSASNFSFLEMVNDTN